MKGTFNRILAGAIALGATFLAGAVYASPSATIVSAVSAELHEPWDGLVDVDYTVDGRTVPPSGSQ